MVTKTVLAIYPDITFSACRTTDEKFKVPNPTFTDLVVKSDDINMDNNPAYQCSSKQDDVKDYHYEIINIDNKVIKSVN